MAYYLQTVEHAEKVARSPVSYMAEHQPKLVMRNFDATNFRSDQDYYKDSIYRDSEHQKSMLSQFDFSFKQF